MKDNIKYCDFGDKDIFQTIFPLVFNVSGNADKDIKNAYEVFADNFFELHPADKEQIVAKRDLQPRTTNQSFLEKFNSPNSLIGLDLPVLISPKSSQSKTIVIVGQDPLRQPEMLKGNASNIILSTPYATHDNSYGNHRDYKETTGKIYWNVSTFLLNNGYSIYYTDVNKLWIRYYDDVIKMPRDLSEKFNECILKELQIIDPQAIITFGKKAAASVRMCGRVPVEFIHPSNTANPWWQRLFRERGIAEQSKEAFIIGELSRILEI